jgi:hypothetical protein
MPINMSLVTEKTIAVAKIERCIPVVLTFEAERKH